MPNICFIRLKQSETVFQVEKVENLRQALLQQGLSPYTSYTQQLNCGGNGICATCGLWIDEGAPRPKHWHDKAARRFGYPRLSCQISVERDMTIRQVDILTEAVCKCKPSSSAVYTDRSGLFKKQTTSRHV